VRGQLAATDGHRILGPSQTVTLYERRSLSTPPPPASPSPEPEQRSRKVFDYVLSVPTSLVLVSYLHVFAAVPRMLWRERYLAGMWITDLMMFGLPVVIMSVCLGAFVSWLFRGATFVGRATWTITLILAVLVYPLAFFRLALGGGTQVH
jgi:hypothetical protein